MKRIAVLLAIAGLGLIGMGVNAGPASAEKPANPGGDAVVAATVVDGGVDISSTKGLSRVTVVLCDGTVLVFDSWDEDQLTAELRFEGVIEAVFIHSGNNTSADAEELLAELGGDDAVKGNSTGAIALHDEDACTPTTTTTEPPVTTTTTEPPVVTTTTTQPTVVVTPPATDTPAPPAPDAPVVNTPDPAPAAPVAGTPVAAVPVDEIAFGGAWSTMLALIGAGVGLLGLSLLLGFRRVGSVA